MTRILIFIFICVIYGCALVITPKNYYRVENNTKKDIDISFFAKSKLQLIVFIKTNEVFDSTIVEDNRGNVLTPFPKNSDSIVVKFSDRKMLRYYCNGRIIYDLGSVNCKIDKEFFLLKQYKSKPINKSYYKLTFDQTDYERAVPF